MIVVERNALTTVMFAETFSYDLITEQLKTTLPDNSYLFLQSVRLLDGAACFFA